MTGVKDAGKKMNDEGKQKENKREEALNEKWWRRTEKQTEKRTER